MASENTSNLTADIESDISSLFLLSNGHVITYYIHLACKLNLASIIGGAGHPLSVNGIAEKIPGEVNRVYLKRLIRFLCAFGVFTESLVEGEGKYSLTRLSNLLRNDIKGQISVKNECEMTFDPVSLKAWAFLEKCVRSEKTLVPYNEVPDDSHVSHDKEHEHPHGESHEHSHEHSHSHEHEYSHDEFNIETLTLVKYYSHGFKELEAKKAHILDLGGHSGSSLAIIKNNFPELECTSLDLPKTIESVKDKPEGVDLVAGDYFKPETVPKADVILMKHIVHMYQDIKECLQLLKTCHQMLPASGRIILCECILPKIGEIDVNSIACKEAFMADASMLLFGVGARTMDEFLEVFDSAGFKLVEFIKTSNVMTQILILEKI